MKIELVKMPLDDETNLGTSHILGCPDVPRLVSSSNGIFTNSIFIYLYSFSMNSLSFFI